MAWRGGTVTTAGGTATARPAWLAAQRAVPAEPQPAAVVRELTTPPDAGPAEKHATRQVEAPACQHGEHGHPRQQQPGAAASRGGRPFPVI